MLSPVISDGHHHNRQQLLREVGLQSLLVDHQSCLFNQQLQIDQAAGQAAVRPVHHEGEGVASGIVFQYDQSIGFQSFGTSAEELDHIQVMQMSDHL